ncbi:hypothetical protein [Prochlorococcus marinus]
MTKSILIEDLFKFLEKLFSQNSTLTSFAAFLNAAKEVKELIPLLIKLT